MNYKEDAIKKIEAELGSVTGSKENAVKNAVQEALYCFIEQDEEFAQAVVQSAKPFKACVKHVVAGCGNSISDLDAYSRAVDFYFPGAKVKFEMRIQVNPYEDDTAPAPARIIDITSLL